MTIKNTLHPEKMDPKGCREWLEKFLRSVISDPLEMVELIAKDLKARILPVELADSALSTEFISSPSDVWHYAKQFDGIKFEEGSCK